MLFALIGRLIASGMLFWALAGHPYAYFTLLRFVVCVVAAYCAVVANSKKNGQWTWTFGAIAVLFNPIIPIHMTREIWNLVDLVVGVILLVSLFFIRGAKPKKPEV